MRTRRSVSALLIVLLLLATLISTASADAMTLGVYFCGKVPNGNGGYEVIPLEGTFTVSQNGVLIGEINPGETLPIEGNGRLLIEPRPETIDPAWDLSAASSEVETVNGSHVTVPVVVSIYGSEVSDAPVDKEETVSEMNEDAVLTDKEEGPASTPMPNERNSESIEAVIPTALPAANFTAEPFIQDIDSADAVATITVQTFFDKNNNSERGANESTVPDIPVYLVDEDGNAVSFAKSGNNGLAVLRVPSAGRYRIKAVLPGNYVFSKKAKSTDLNSSCMGLTVSAEQESESFSVSKGDRLEMGIGLQNGLTVSGVCWFDTDGDGIMSKEEPKMPGVHITLTGQKNGLTFETWTDENGAWKINRVRPGFYDLSGYTPDGFMFTKYSKSGGKNRSIFTNEGATSQTKSLDTNDGKSVADQNIGFAVSGSVSGQCFLDANYNGVFDEGETPLAGVKVTAVKQSKDEEIAVAMSDSEGKYVLSGLRGNTYKIRAVLPDDGSTFTKVSEEPLGNHFVSRPGRREYYLNDFTMGDGEQRIVNVGAIYYASVSGTVYLDDDFSGSRNGNEKAVQGISVQLFDENGNLVDSKNTGTKGQYSFEELVPGCYSLRMTAKSGYAFTCIGDGNVMNNLNNGEGYSDVFAVPLGSSITGKNAGMIKPATVSGTVFADSNDDAVRNSDEIGLVGTIVSLMDDNGEVFRQTIGENGEFLFDAVMPGKYYLRYQLPDNAIFAEINKNGNSLSGENGIAATGWFTLKTDDLYNAPLCGGLVLGGMNGCVFADPDGSGVMDVGSKTIAGVKIVLTPERTDLETVEVVTEADGTWAVEGLHPDRWMISLELPESYVTTRMKGVTLPFEAGKQNQAVALNLTMGQRWTDQKIGVCMPACISGIAWLDENNDGIRNEEEQTPAGIVIRIIDTSDGSEFAAIKTGEDGTFSCNGMIPGTFDLEMALPANSDAAVQGESTFKKENNKLVMKGIQLSEGEANDSARLGFIEYTRIEGAVWVDRAGDIEKLEGARIRLLRDGEQIVDTIVTGENGAYAFSGLLPGRYMLDIMLPEGYLVVEPDDERLDDSKISVIQNTNGREGDTGWFDLVMGLNRLSMDIGSVLPGTIGDWCWLDDNENGWQDGGECGIPGVKVELQRNGVTVAETISERDGYYWFREVYPAIYTLKVTPPEEVKPTQKRTDIYLIVSSLKETEDTVCYTDPISVQSDKTDFNIDLGFTCRQKGVYPSGLGEGRKMDWSVVYEPKGEE